MSGMFGIGVGWVKVPLGPTTPPPDPGQDIITRDAQTILTRDASTVIAR